LPSLELRRLRFDLIYCYKIIFGLIDIDFTNFWKLELHLLQGGTHTRFSNVIVHAQFNSLSFSEYLSN